MYYVVIDIGCSDCGESSNVVGIFTDEELAREALKNYKIQHNLDKYGYDHEFEIYKIQKLDTIQHNGLENLIYTSSEGE
ncbi:hypothetical protein GJU40_05585 [Bacillus lacus]|uniref:DUF7336 domain-containing protein n=1 Tax=Metabacillus lacus TaxID=1983721 RepID=A0A7X2LWM5_9BACI|nr:hypothetical protein [Metabacillus lacus]MRX71645.1 hypothetical protein [Metabacillus lacus]